MTTRITTLFFAFFCSCLSLMAQTPPNDECTAAVNLGVISNSSPCPNTIYSNLNATTSNIGANNAPACFNGGLTNRDVWYSFEVAAGVSNVEIRIVSDFTPQGIKNPQAALYRGVCAVDGLDELACARSTNGSTALKLVATALNPSETYFIRVNDWTPTASPNAGNFQICVVPFEPIYKMGVTDTVSTLCAGTLFDSGGEGVGSTFNYQNGENYTFVIRPSDPFQCLELSLDTMSTESMQDVLEIYDGTIQNGVLLEKLSGLNRNIKIQIRNSQATLRFRSDAVVNYGGFKLTWACSSTACTTPIPTTCSNTQPIQMGLPLSSSTLGDGDVVQGSRCDNDDFLKGKDHIFKFNSNGNVCGALRLNSIQAGVGVGVYDVCPSEGVGTCIALGNSNNSNQVNLDYLNFQKAGEYFIVVARANGTTDFTIVMDTVACRSILPTNGECPKALSFVGCDQTAIVQVEVGGGDNNFITNDNRGCINSPSQDRNFAFFFFQAQKDGTFAFTARANDTTSQITDIDFNVWAGVDSLSKICDFIQKNQPIRSSYAPLRLEFDHLGRTGLAFQRPDDGTAVEDSLDCESLLTPNNKGDMFLRSMEVKKGKFYAVLLDDYGNKIEGNGLFLDFSESTTGIFGEITLVPTDTALCPSDSVQLLATGGTRYEWTPTAGLSCTDCPNPLAKPTVSTNYQVKIDGTCGIEYRNVQVDIFKLNAQSDRETCLNDKITFNLGKKYAAKENAVYAISGDTPAAESLVSCLDCNEPIFTASTSGDYTYFVSLITPKCTFRDTFFIRVYGANNPNPVFVATQQICIGDSVQIGGTTELGTTYSWSPSATLSCDTCPNPTAKPSVTTTYILKTSNFSCPVENFDSVTVVVSTPPNALLTADTSVCESSPVFLNLAKGEKGVSYLWTPNSGLDSDTIPQPTARPTADTDYILTATKGGCVVKDTVKIKAIQLSASINITEDTTRICRGTPLNLMANITPLTATPTVSWRSTDRQFQNVVTNNITATPSNHTRYFLTAMLGGCKRLDTLQVLVDSLPDDTRIMPKDTTVCFGSLVTLKSKTYEPIFFGGMVFKWTTNRPMGANTGMLTPDSLYNLVVSPDSTTRYYRLDSFGVCKHTDSATVTIKYPPTITVSPQDTHVCFGTAVRLTARTTGEVDSVTWKGANNYKATGEVQTITAPIAGANMYEVTANNKLCPMSTNVTIFVESPPNLDFINKNINTCSGKTVELNPMPQGRNTYKWSGAGGFTSTQVNPSVTATTSTSYNVEVADSLYGCKSNTTVTLNVATANLTVTNDTSICANTSVTLNASATPTGGTYRWNTGQTTQSINVTPSTNANYSVVYTFGDGCTTEKTVRVTAIPNFTLRITPDTFAGRQIDQGSPIDLMVTVGGNAPNPSIQWTLGSTVLSTDRLLSTVLSGDSLTTFKVTVSSSNGCQQSASVAINVVAPTFDLPNAFSPNEDNLNETFNILFQSPRFRKGLLKIQEFRVYDRWGAAIYVEDDFNFLNGNSFRGWNGRRQNSGADAPADVYAYIIKLIFPNGDIKTLSGEVNLLR